MHADKPYDLSVVLVSFMAGEEVRECLQSLRAFQEGLRCELIVVDNSPPDASQHLAGVPLADVRVIPNQRNVGYAAACNRGLQEARSAYLLFLNPDARYLSGSGRELIAWLERESSVGLVGPQVLNPDGTRQFSSRSFPTWTTAFCHRYSLLTQVFPNNRFTRRYLRTDLDREPAEVDWASGCCLVARRNALEEVSGFDEGYFLFFEDVDLAYRLRKRGVRCVYYPSLVFSHRIGISRASPWDFGTMVKYLSAARYFAKNAIGSRLLADFFAVESSLSRMLFALERLRSGRPAPAISESPLSSRHPERRLETKRRDAGH